MLVVHSQPGCSVKLFQDYNYSSVVSGGISVAGIGNSFINVRVILQVKHIGKVISGGKSTTESFIVPV